MIKTITAKYLNFIRTLIKPTKKLFILGVAFKGQPETSDVRFSTALTIKDILTAEGQSVTAYDFIAKREEIENEGIEYKLLPDDISSYDGMFVMNNNPNHLKIDIYKLLRTAKKPFFFFDGWNLFDKEEIESIPFLTYSTLGYQTFKK